MPPIRERLMRTLLLIGIVMSWSVPSAMAPLQAAVCAFSLGWRIRQDYDVPTDNQK